MYSSCWNIFVSYASCVPSHLQDQVDTSKTVTRGYKIEIYQGFCPLTWKQSQWSRLAIPWSRTESQGFCKIKPVAGPSVAGSIRFLRVLEQESSSHFLIPSLSENAKRRGSKLLRATRWKLSSAHCIVLHTTLQRASVQMIYMEVC